ncbi:hypothetical protein HY500_00885 [Candidatus Woesearchaeota archaeon]|nr:hypothetical protein [Candidatus Woesearchaeota archaeon]
MKTKISISIEEETLKKIEEVLEEGIFRNKSHVIEYSIKKFLENDRKN